MRCLLDTNIIIDAVAGCRPAVEALERAVQSDWVGYSAITRLELFGYPDLTPEEEFALTSVARQFQEIPVHSGIVDRAIQIRKSVRIKVPDAIIAATALEANASLITRNENDFKMVERLIVINPWTA